MQQIPDEWAPFAVPLDRVTLYPGNAKRHDLDLLRDSLRRRGQYRMAVVQRSTGYVLVGNGMVEAMRAEGWPLVAVHEVDVDDDEARELVLLDNRSSELGGYDTRALVELLQAMPTLEHTGYDETTLADLVAVITPPDLDLLHGEFGDPTEDDGFERIAIRVPPHVAQLWREAGNATGLEGVERDAALVWAAHAAVTGAG